MAEVLKLTETQASPVGISDLRLNFLFALAESPVSLTAGMLVAIMPKDIQQAAEEVDDDADQFIARLLQSTNQAVRHQEQTDYWVITDSGNGYLQERLSEIIETANSADCLRFIPTIIARIEQLPASAVSAHSANESKATLAQLHAWRENPEWSAAAGRVQDEVERSQPAITGDGVPATVLGALCCKQNGVGLTLGQICRVAGLDPLTPNHRADLPAQTIQDLLTAELIERVDCEQPLPRYRLRKPVG